ncbi:Tim44 domain-containing protein [Marinomonas profundimaris]|uniref:Import inner membrane translocase subunit Tim44 n=1 Tax=Marinomonas profundimaris TaxID=1208321 RepID=W1RT77_9GAMM|nr:TIM44-like domain-containing protein [Marinomonas profundimaris]ETI58073.1 import inner membrane translocase subunit Tim44 [Marinomonas profundimaris]
MKTTVYAILMAFVLAVGVGGYSADLEAKAKFGGGKSFGKSFSISKPKSATAGTSKATNSAASTGAKKPGFLGGLGGGLLGGLLVGGLFATLFGSGAFSGISFGDILLFALVGFLVYKFFIAPKRRAAAEAGTNGMFREAAGNHEHVQPTPMTGISGFGGQPEIQLPEGFNEQAFVEEAKNHYITLQKAWDDNNFDEILDYVSPELYNLLVAERATHGDNKPRTEVVSLMVEIVRGEVIGTTASISLQFSGWIKEGDETSDSNEIWHLEKNMSDANANWTIVGIQQDN